MSYAELLAKTSFSFLEGASQPDELVQSAKQRQLHTLVVCDRGGLYGAVRAWAAAKEVGQRIGFGAEFEVALEADFELGTVTPGAVTPGAVAHRAAQGAARGSAQEAQPSGLTLSLLVEDVEGYHSLCYLLTRAHAGEAKSPARLRLEMLRERSAGLTLVLPVQTDLERALDPRLDVWWRELSRRFVGRGFIAIYRRLDGQDAARLQCAQRWAELTGFAVVAVGAPLFHEPERKPLADIVYCIRHGLDLAQAGTALASNGEAYLRGAAEMQLLFPNDPDWIERSVHIAERLRFSFDQIGYQFPCELPPGRSADEHLRILTQAGAARRYPRGIPAGVTRQIEKELALISQLQVAAYFICTYEIVQLARARQILCQGRGSAANSAVCFVLGITAVDPERSSLLFERFLSAERSEPPDIDVDFEHERREEVIQDIYAQYGREHAAMVSEVIRYQAKSALREVSKVFGMSPTQSDRLSAMVSHWDEQGLSPERVRQYGFDPEEAALRQVLYWSKCLQGFPRHLSIHVGGFVLSKTPLWHVAPVEPATMPDRTVVGWDKDDIDLLGFFKVDVLGLGMLTAIRKALEFIHRDGELRAAEGAEAFDPLEVVTRVPAEDPAVYALASEADTVGVFQIESRAQMAMLPRLRPQRFYDLVIEVALVRPGPIQGGMVHPYLRRRNGEEDRKAPHPSLEPILERTLGVPLFQEQVMQISMVGAGYTAGQADQLRRDMAAWKRSGKLLRHREQLLQGFVQNGISAEFAEALFEQIKGFGEYGFPESHAASFALLVYLSAWQKAHFPAHFVAALINSQPMGFYSPSSLVRDARDHGVEVRPVCIVQSNWDCTLEVASPKSRLRSVYPAANRAVRLGLRLVKGLRRESVRRIELARKEAPFESLHDVVRRARLKRDETEALSEAGAFEQLIEGRRQALWAARAPRGEGLFAAVDLPEPKVALRPLELREQLVLDYERVGVSLAPHPLTLVRKQLRTRGVVTAKQLAQLPHGSRAQVAGLVLARQRPATASGVLFMTLEDETGVVNGVVFNHVFARFEQLARHASALVANGIVERQETPVRAGEVGRSTPVIHLVVHGFNALEMAPKVASRDFR